MPNDSSAIDTRGPYFAEQTDWNDGALHKHLCRLAQVAEATASAVVITDVQGVIVWVNHSFTHISGYSFDESIGKIPGHLLQGPETNREEVARIAAALRARTGVAAELINYAKGGRRFWIGMKIEPLFDALGNVDGFMAFGADITERQERNRALKRLTERFDLATQAAHIGMYEFNATFEEVWWSKVMWEIFDQDPLKFSPSLAAWHELIHGDDRERVRAQAGSPGHDRTSQSIRYRIVRPDGSIRHVQSIGATGDEVGLSGALLDVTERVQAEERESVLQQRLRESSHHAGMAEIATGVLHNVGNVLNSLGIANSTANRGLKALRVDRLEQAIASILSHRTTLAAFLTEDQRGKHIPDYLSALSAQMASNVKAVRAEIDTIEHLLEHLRDIVSAQQARARVGGSHELIDLKELAESALLMQASDLAQIQVIRQFEDTPPVMTDRHKLVQILVNFISNASDAVRANSLEPGRILIRIARDEDHALIVIEDSGIGMSAETLAGLWQFGFTTKQNGHGFGLHNSANAAHGLCATLSAHSDGTGRGSRFTLRLPFVCNELMHAEAAA